MAIENLGGAGALSDAQISVIKEKFGDTKAEELINLFESGEDKGEAGLYDDADLLGFAKADLEVLAAADPAFKAMLEGKTDAVKSAAGAAGADGAEAADDTAKADDTKADAAEKAADDGDTRTVLTREDVEKLEEEVAALKAKLESFDAEMEAKLEAKEKELEAKQAELDEAKEAYEAEQAELDRLTKLYNDNKDAYEDVTDAIEEATKDLEDEMKAEQQSAIYKAMAEYDQEKDGSWESFLNKKLEGVVGGGALSGLIDSLSSKESALLRTLGNLQLQISAQTGLVTAAKGNYANVQADYDAINGEITGIKAQQAQKADLESQLETKTKELESAVAIVAASGTATVPIGDKSDMTIDEIKSKISDKEMAFVEEKGLDLTEKLADGSPKYIFAEGADGNYHIYDMSYGAGNQGATLARLYGEGGGFDIVKSGSGYLNGLQEASENNGRPVYYICGDNLKQFQGCYGTSSPLSLDLNGDGVKTSENIVDFDIDGDGIVDKINDSADGVLVFDKDGDGISGEDGSECFGDNTDIDGDGKKDGYKDGFEALKAFARDKGLINDADDMVLDADDIKYLEENFGFGIKAGGYTSETQTLTELGITEINLAKTDATSLQDDFDGNGNQLMTQEGATFVQNGETKEYADIWHKKQDVAEDAKADDAPKAKATTHGGLSFDVKTHFDDVDYLSILNDKLEGNSSRKNAKFNIFDVNVDKPKENDDKKKKEIDQ